MTAYTRTYRLPSWVPYFNPIARFLLAAGVPMGPEVLLTVRGRKSGLPRSTPVTICRNTGRRGLIRPFGETDWVRNPRAAGCATLTVGRRQEEVIAVELGPVEAAEFIRDILAPHARRTRLARGSCAIWIRSISTTPLQRLRADRYSSSARSDGNSPPQASGLKRLG